MWLESSIGLDIPLPFSSLGVVLLALGTSSTISTPFRCRHRSRCDRAASRRCALLLLLLLPLRCTRCLCDRGYPIVCARHMHDRAFHASALTRVPRRLAALGASETFGGLMRSTIPGPPLPQPRSPTTRRRRSMRLRLVLGEDDQHDGGGALKTICMLSGRTRRWPRRGHGGSKVCIAAQILCTATG